MKKAVSGLASQYAMARSRAPLVCSAAGVSIIFAPKAARIFRLSALATSLMKMRTGKSMIAPSVARAMAVLPLLASTTSMLGLIRPRAIASRIIWRTGLSLIDMGLNSSSLANTFALESGYRRSRASNGVFPMRSVKSFATRMIALPSSDTST